MYTENTYKIDEEAIKKSFAFTETKLTHKQDGRFKLLPFVANDKKLVNEFSGVVGAFSRAICGKKLNTDFNAESFLEEVADTIGDYGDDTNNRENFKDLVRTMFLEGNKLIDFDIKTINYIPSTSAEDKIASFITSVLLDKESVKNIEDNYNKEVENILYRLVLKSLPELKEKNISLGEYYCYIPFIKELFIEDFKFIISNEELYKNNLKRLLEYYYMFYISQLSMKLNKFENVDLDKPEILYYTLDWEKTSKARTAYRLGLNNIKNNIDNLFSHAIVLELLNHSNLEGQHSYVDLAKVFDNMDEQIIDNEIENLINLYTNQINDVSWSDFKYKNKEDRINGFNGVNKLFNSVVYQFGGSSTRLGANKKYSKWYTEFYQKNFGKRRGSLGYNLNITEDDIILMTKICIKYEDKLKLNILFEEFEKRGLLFDTDSKRNIIQLFEKLNILEKKSDSGDAQYVKSIL